MPNENFELMLEKYADVIVNVGLNLQPGQRLFVSAEMNTKPLVRQVVAKAYQSGCSLVTVIWSDEQLRKIRHQYAPRDSFEEIETWIPKGMLEGAKSGNAYLSITGLDPELLTGQDPELIGVELKTRAKYFKPVSEYVTNGAVQWTVVCPPTPKWASKVFPDLSEEDAESQLWEVMFKLCRLDNDDPIAVWREHLNNLKERHEYLSAKQYESLHFTGPGTDLVVGMPQKHIWAGGGSKTNDGVDFAANLPTEEVFSMPHREKTEGTVRATKPLNYHGNLIENFSLTFEAGRVVDFSAEKGEDTLRQMLESDENAVRLGEVALVPHHSPISESGLIFFNTLYDENAACHLALGSAYKTTIERGNDMSKEELLEAGVNSSLIHVDFMIGSDKVDIDGITTEGAREPIMRAGKWTFDV